MSEREAATLRQGDEATLRRVVFTETCYWAATVEAETADLVLADWADIIDVAETLEQIKLANPHDMPFEAWLTVEAVEDQAMHVPDWGVLDGTKPESFYWSARKAVMEARTVLSRGRYREGNCPEMDAVNASLGRIEEELRLLALAVDAQRKEADHG